MLCLLDLYRDKQYIAPRILQLVLNYMTLAVNHSLSWKIIKPHMQAVIHDVIFPLMCHSDEDEELWGSDPVEYIRVKYGAYKIRKQMWRYFYHEVYAKFICVAIIIEI